MIRPRFNELENGDRVVILEGWFEDIGGGTVCAVTAIKKNSRGQTVWADLDDGSGLEPIRIDSGDGITSA